MKTAPAIRGVFRGARTSKRKSFRGALSRRSPHESSTPGCDSRCAPPKGAHTPRIKSMPACQVESPRANQPTATKTQTVKNTRRCPRLRKLTLGRFVIRRHNQNTPKGQNSKTRPDGLRDSLGGRGSFRKVADGIARGEREAFRFVSFDDVCFLVSMGCRRAD